MSSMSTCHPVHDCVANEEIAPVLADLIAQLQNTFKNNDKEEVWKKHVMPACFNAAKLARNVYSGNKPMFCEYPEFFYSIDDAFAPAAKKFASTVCKVGNMYWVQKRVDEEVKWMPYKEREIQEMYRNEQLIWVEAEMEEVEDKTGWQMHNDGIQNGVEPTDSELVPPLTNPDGTPYTIKTTSIMKVAKCKSASFIKHYLQQRAYRYEKEFILNTPPEHMTEYEAEHGLNLWTPFAAESMPLPCSRAKAKHTLEMILKHLYMLCGQSGKFYTFARHWLAFVVQAPHRPAGVILTFIGPQGSGKSILTDLLKLMVGSTKYMSTATPELDVWGKFNARVMGKVLVELSEICKHSNTKTENYIENQRKDKVTNKRIRIEKKGCDAAEINSGLHMICNTNDACPFGAGRRYAQQVVSPGMPIPHVDCDCTECTSKKAYFAELAGMTREPTAARILFEYLMRVDKGNVLLTVNDIPKTEARQHAAESMESEEQQFLRHLIAENKPTGNKPLAIGGFDMNDLPEPDPKNKEKLQVVSNSPPKDVCFSLGNDEIWNMYCKWTCTTGSSDAVCKTQHALVSKMGALKNAELDAGLITSKKVTLVGKTRGTKWTFNVTRIEAWLETRDHNYQVGTDADVTVDVVQEASDFVDKLSSELGAVWPAPCTDDGCAMRAADRAAGTL